MLQLKLLMTLALLHRAVLELFAVLEGLVLRASVKLVFAATHTPVADRNVLRTQTVRRPERASARIAVIHAKEPVVSGQTVKPSTIYPFVPVHLEREETPSRDVMSSCHVCIEIN